jgi:hypothetical protein
VSIQNTVGTTFVSPTVVPIQLTAARIDDASRPAGASRNHDTRRLHAIAPGLVGQTIERAGRLQAGCSSSWPTPGLGRLNVDSCQGGAQRSALPSLSMEPGVSAQSLQVLIKQADLDRARRNDGLTSEEVRPPRRKVRCPLPCVASAATSHASALPDSGLRFPQLGSDAGGCDAVQRMAE